MNKNTLNLLAQIALPSSAIATQVAIALKFPQWGLIINLIAQPFWMYSSWRAYKQAGQIGLFVTSIIITIIVGFGVLNYWVL